MQIDIKKLGYRWKGVYNSLTTYDAGDVVYKDSGTYRIDDNNNLVSFGLGQQDVTTKGHLLTGGASLGGAKASVLHSAGNSGIEFRFGDERNTYAVKSLGEDVKSNRGEAYPYNYFTPRLLMSDGTVRSWGQANNDGRHGWGNHSNNSASYETKRVAFPKGVVIDKLYGGVVSCIAVDTNGHSWGWGSYAGNGSQSVQIPVRHYDTLPELQNEKIVEVEHAYQWYGEGNYMLRTESGKLYTYGYNGYGQCGDGTTTNITTIKRVGENEFTSPIAKILKVMPYTYGFTCVKDTNGDVWTTGNHSNYGLTPQGTSFQKQTKFTTGDIVDIVANIQDGHWVAGAQYYGCLFVLMANGDAYNLTASGLNQTSWGGTNNYTNHLFATNCKEIVGENGGYGRAMYRGNSNDSNGENTLYYRGYNGGSVNNSNPTGANTTTWHQVIDENGQSIKAIKMGMYGAHYSSHLSALTATGKLYMWGFTQSGSSGRGNSLTNEPANVGLKPAYCPEKIVDYQVNGYSSSGTGYFTILALGESGKCYVCGYNNYGSANNINGNYHTFQPLRY